MAELLGVWRGTQTAVICVYVYRVTALLQVLLMLSRDFPGSHCSSLGSSGASRASCQELHVRAGELIIHSTSTELLAFLVTTSQDVLP